MVFSMVSVQKLEGRLVSKPAQNILRLMENISVAIVIHIGINCQYSDNSYLIIIDLHTTKAVDDVGQLLRLHITTKSMIKG